MATNNEIPALPAIGTLSASDKILVYDVSLQPNGERAITIESLFESYIGSLPTSSSGLAIGDLWLNSGVLTRKMS
jgi:hypothetical protein